MNRKILAFLFVFISLFLFAKCCFADIVNVDDSTFGKEVFMPSSDDIVLVDFWATWCGPCVQQGEILKSVENEPFMQNVKIVKARVEEARNAQQVYKVRSIPTILLVRRGRVMDRWSGVAAKEVLEDRINRVRAVKFPESKK